MTREMRDRIHVALCAKMKWKMALQFFLLDRFTRHLDQFSWIQQRRNDIGKVLFPVFEIIYVEVLEMLFLWLISDERRRLNEGFWKKV